MPFCNEQVPVFLNLAENEDEIEKSEIQIITK